jgi:thioredoxin reductase (NADPH)
VGEDRLEGVEDNRSGTRRALGAQALFVFIAAETNTGWLEGTVDLDESGFILTGRTLDRSALEGNACQGLSREPYLLERSLPGVFATSDVRGGSRVGMTSAQGHSFRPLRSRTR